MSTSPRSSRARGLWLASSFLFAPVAFAQQSVTKTPAPLPHELDVKTPAPAPVQHALDDATRPAPRGSTVLPPKHAPVARPAPSIDFTRVYVDEPGDGAIWAHGATYKAKADAHGFTYIPFFGSSAPRNFPVSFELRSIALGGETLPLASAGTLSRSDDRVVIDRGNALELYDLDPNGAKQEFVFESLPRSGGDLTVRMAISSELEPRASSEGIELANDLGFVRYGKATAFDASGKSLAIESAIVDGTLELRVPASFLADARLPVTIDPVISTFTVDTSTSDELQPDVAYEASSNTYVVCWERVFSATDHDIWSQTHDANGFALSASTFAIDFTSSWWAHPRIATNALASQFLVVAAVGDPAAATRSIWGRTREAEAGYTMSTQFQVSDPAVTSDQFDPDVGGDPVLVGPTYYCVVWTRHFASTDRDVFARLVTPSATLVGTTNIYFDNSGGSFDINPSVSKSDGQAPFSSQNWNLAWERTVSSSVSEIHGGQIRWDGTITTPSFLFLAPGGRLTWPSASPGIDVGGTRYYVVAHERDFSTDRDIQYCLMNGSTIVESTILHGLENNGLLLQDQVRPSAETDGSCFAIAYSEQYQGSTIDYDVWVSSIFFNGAHTSLIEGHANLAFSGTYEIDAQLGSRFSGGGAVGEAIGGTWRDFSYFTNTGDVEGGIYDCPTSAPTESFCFGDGSAGVACPCGGGFFGAGCPNSLFAGGAQLYTSGNANVSGDTFVLHGTDMPNANALYFQGTDSTFGTVIDDGIGCVGGLIIRLGTELNASNMSQYPSAGDTPISIRGAIPSTAGETRTYQCFYRNAANFCTPATSNRTNAVRVTWLP